MRIRQYVYFALSSETITATAITDVVGIEPDRISVRGSRRSHPAIPVARSWKIRCDEHGLTVDEQIERVSHRIQAATDSIRRLVKTADVTAVLQIVRDFDADDGEEDDLDDTILPTGEVITKLAGQHQLLGWHVDAATVAFLASIPAEIDCDEYGS